MTYLVGEGRTTTLFRPMARIRVQKNSRTVSGAPKCDGVNLMIDFYVYYGDAPCFQQTLWADFAGAQTERPSQPLCER